MQVGGPPAPARPVLRAAGSVLRRPFVCRLIVIAGFAVGAWLAACVHFAHPAYASPAPRPSHAGGIVSDAVRAVRGATGIADRVTKAATRARPVHVGTRRPIARRVRTPAVGVRHTIRAGRAHAVHDTTGSSPDTVAGAVSADLGTTTAALRRVTGTVAALGPGSTVATLSRRVDGLVTSVTDVVAGTVAAVPVRSPVGALIGGPAPVLAYTPADASIARSRDGPTPSMWPAAAFACAGPGQQPGICAFAAFYRHAPERADDSEDGDGARHPPVRPAAPISKHGDQTSQDSPPQSGHGDVNRSVRAPVIEAIRLQRVDHSPAVRTSADEPVFSPD
jgi:hypothetical protein